MKKYPYPLTAILIGIVLISAPFVAELLGRSANERTTLIMMAIGGGALLSALTGFVAESIRASFGDRTIEIVGVKNVTAPPEAPAIAKAPNGFEFPKEESGHWTFYQPAFAPVDIVSEFFDPDVETSKLKPSNYADVLYFVTRRAPRRKNVYFAHRDHGIGKVVARSGDRLILQDWGIGPLANRWLQAKKEDKPSQPT